MSAFLKLVSLPDYSAEAHRLPCLVYPSYSQCFPSRFRKDIVKAAIASSRRPGVVSPSVSADGIDSVLQNIGMGHRMSRAEIESIVSEVGVSPAASNGERHSYMSDDQMLELISRK